MSDYIGKADVDDGLLVCHFCERLNASVFVSCRSGFFLFLSLLFFLKIILFSEFM
jgi:hypothetical protein